MNQNLKWQQPFNGNKDSGIHYIQLDPHNESSLIRIEYSYVIHRWKVQAFNRMFTWIIKENLTVSQSDAVKHLAMQWLFEKMKELEEIRKQLEFEG